MVGPSLLVGISLLIELLLMVVFGVQGSGRSTDEVDSSGQVDDDDDDGELDCKELASKSSSASPGNIVASATGALGTVFSESSTRHSVLIAQ